MRDGLLFIVVVGVVFFVMGGGLDGRQHAAPKRAALTGSVRVERTYSHGTGYARAVVSFTNTGAATVRTAFVNCTATARGAIVGVDNGGFYDFRDGEIPPGATRTKEFVLSVGDAAWDAIGCEVVRLE